MECGKEGRKEGGRDMAYKTAGKIAAELLKEWNIDHIYGMPGDSINELINELRHEKTASALFRCAMKKQPLLLPRLMRN